MPISQDEHYQVYNFGITEGRAIVKSYLTDEDILEFALEAFSRTDAKEIEDQESLHDLIRLVRNFIDGIEDGIKTQLGKECLEYVKWMRDNL